MFSSLPVRYYGDTGMHTPTQFGASQRWLYVNGTLVPVSGLPVPGDSRDSNSGISPWNYGNSNPTIQYGTPTTYTGGPYVAAQHRSLDQYQMPRQNATYGISSAAARTPNQYSVPQRSHANGPFVPVNDSRGSTQYGTPAPHIGSPYHTGQSHNLGHPSSPPQLVRTPALHAFPATPQASVMSQAPTVVLPVTGSSYANPNTAAHTEQSHVTRQDRRAARDAARERILQRVLKLRSGSSTAVAPSVAPTANHGTTPAAPPGIPPGTPDLTPGSGL
jgi:hypothetical protein